MLPSIEGKYRAISLGPNAPMSPAAATWPGIAGHITLSDPGFLEGVDQGCDGFRFHALRVKYLLLAEGSGLKFRVAARKKNIFSRLYAGSLEDPTASTESAVSGRLDSSVLSTIPRPIEERPTDNGVSNLPTKR